MAKKKKDISVEDIKFSSIDSATLKDIELKVEKEDNPLSKKVIPEIDKVPYNKNNEILSDSDLINNVII